MKDKVIIFRISNLFTLLFMLSIFAQKETEKKDFVAIGDRDYVRCSTVDYEEKLTKENLNKTSKEAFEIWMSSKISQVKKNSISGKIAEEVYTIPVVVHIIHDGDEVNTPRDIIGENISDAQVLSQINVLNQDFRREENTPGGNNSTGIAVDVGINFVLAKQDPIGIETSGIIRHNIAPYTDEVENESTNSAGGGGADWENYEDIQRMKLETQWDPTRYLNIWTIRTGGETVENDGVSDLLGFAQFPDNSGLEGLNDTAGFAMTDGVVLVFHAFGDRKENDGSFVLNNTYNEGRTTTHEVGHWLGLRHIWGDTNTCGNDDYCADTPDARREHTDCNANYDTCSNDGLGADMVENYMDYTPDICMDTFTQDQKDRMITVLKNSPRRVELLTSTGLEAPLYTNEDLENFIIDPNPVTDEVTISGFAEDSVKLSIFNSSGKELFSEKYYDVEDIFSEKIEVNQLETGVYIILIENGSDKVIKKMIKK